MSLITSKYLQRIAKKGVVKWSSIQTLQATKQSRHLSLTMVTVSR